MEKAFKKRYKPRSKRLTDLNFKICKFSIGIQGTQIKNKSQVTYQKKYL